MDEPQFLEITPSVTSENEDTLPHSASIETSDDASIVTTSELDVLIKSEKTSSIIPPSDTVESIEKSGSKQADIIPVLQQVINFNEPSSWPCITDSTRITLVLHGPDQGKNIDFRNIDKKDGRRFLPQWFQKKMPNGETVDRNWMMYSEKKMPYSAFPAAYLNVGHLKYLQSPIVIKGSRIGKT